MTTIELMEDKIQSLIEENLMLKLKDNDTATMANATEKSDEAMMIMNVIRLLKDD